MKLSVIIPSYNEEKTVAEIIQKVHDVVIPEITKEIIVIDDGSKDATYRQILSVKKDVPELTIIRHKKNKGKGAAVIAGIKKAKGNIVIIQDADLEYDPKDIPRIVKPILAHKAHVVYGSRLKTKPKLFGKDKTPFIHHFYGNKMLSLLTSLLYGYKVTDMETGYKAFEKKILDGLKLKSRSFEFEPEITAKIMKKKIRIVEVSIKTKPRNYKEGKKLHTFRDGVRAFLVLFKYRVSD